MCLCSVVSTSLRAPSTVALQAPLFMGFSRQEYWRGLPFLPLRDLPDPGIEPRSPETPGLVGRLFNTVGSGKHFPGKPQGVLPTSQPRWS